MTNLEIIALCLIVLLVILLGTIFFLKNKRHEKVVKKIKNTINSNKN